MHKYSIALLLSFAFFAQGISQTVSLLPGMNRTTIKYIKNSNTTTPCIVWAPDDWDPNSSKKYPIIIAYHGAEAAISVTGISGNQDLSILLGNGILVNLNKGQKAQTNFGGQLVKFIVVAPQAASYTADTSWFNPNINDITKRLLIGTGGQVKIDSSRIYITGYSAGGKPSVGNTCLSSADSIYSRMIAATVIMSPATQDVNFPKLNLAAKRNIHFLGFTGGLDPSYITQMNRVRDTIQKYNNSLFPIADVIAGNAHCCFDQYWDTAFAVPGFGRNIFQWLLQFQRGSSSLPPVISPGADQTILLPRNSVMLNGSAANGTNPIVSTAWTELSGPNTATISLPGSLSSSVTNLIQGVYIFQLSATDSIGLTSNSAIRITVQQPVPPKANAGGNPSIIQPANSLNLNGTITAGTGGPVVSVLWTQRSGPSSATLVSPATLSTQATGLVAGTYVFRLLVTDSVGNSGTDSSVVTVYSASGNSVNVRLYAGTIPFQNPVWNNWNVGAAAVTNKGTGVLKFSNGTTSPITAVLSYQDNLGDNGTGYVSGATMCPDTALRFSSYTTSNRTLTISGLDNATKYSLEFYASRNRSDGQKTTFTIGSQAMTVSTDFNGTSAAKFSAIAPTSNKIVVTITKGSTYSYLNAFKITVNLVNTAPVLTVDGNQTITLPVNNAIIHGTAIAGSSKIVSTLWSQTSGSSPADIASPAALTTFLSNLGKGVYVFKLTVTDSAGLTVSGNVQVTVLPQPVPPVSNAGPGQIIQLPLSSILLAGSDTAGSSKIISVLWSQVSGPSSAVITTPIKLNPTVTNLIAGDYVFRLTVTDSNSLIAISTVQITVKPAIIPPTVTAGADQTILFPANATVLNGVGVPGSSPIISARWTMIAGPEADDIISADSLTTQVTNLTSGTYTFQLTLTDSIGSTASDSTQVIVLPPAPPVARAGNDIAVLFPDQSAYIQAVVKAGSSPIVSTLWNEISGPVAAELVTPDSLGTDVRGMTEGSYVFQIMAVDSLGLTSASTVQIHVQGAVPPLASAGMDQSFIFPVNTTKLFGNEQAGSTPIVSGVWMQVDGPSIAEIADSTQRSPSLSGLIPGDYTFQYAVRDSLDLISRDSVTIHVLPAIGPSNNAGSNQTITFPNNAIILHGTATAGSSPVISAVWSQTAGPVTLLIADSTLLQTPVDGFIPGTFSFRLVSTDSLGLTVTAFTQIVVKPPLPPAVDAGSDQTITLPVNMVVLNGSVVSGSSKTVSIVWAQAAGPAGAVIGSPGATSTTISNLILGSYIFRLTVTDSLGNTVYDSAKITVNPVVPSLINVRLYAGTAPFRNTAWNNWNVGSGTVTNPTSPLLNYSNGSVSTIKAVLSYQDNIGDNGTAYTSGATMCPDTAIRFSSYATINRTLTLTGLSNSKKYTISLYASRDRTDGQKTTFSSGGQSVTVATDKNATAAAKLTSLAPTSGSIVISFTRFSTYNYLNGFSVTEIAGGGGSISASEKADETGMDINLFPNPASNYLTVTFGGMHKMDIQIFTMDGRNVITSKGNVSRKEIAISALAAGQYILMVTDETTREVSHRLFLKY